MIDSNPVKLKSFVEMRKELIKRVETGSQVEFQSRDILSLLYTYIL